MGDAFSDSREAARQSLRQVLVERYDALVRKLAARLGSPDLADDALHEAWLRLERAPEPAVVKDPFAYILRVALNLGSDRRRREVRRAGILAAQGEAEGPDRLLDDAPDPEQVVAARSEWAAIKRALAALPERRQAIVLAAWVEGVPYEVLAKRHGVTVRTIQTEVKRALEHCAVELQRK
jgi:RNA polymerase sigma-70 factor (ECF subfamily)